MKRCIEESHDKKKQKKKRLTHDTKNVKDIYKIIVNVTTKSWFFTREILDTNLLPRDIGIIIMNLFNMYPCSECHEHVIPLIIPSIIPSICVPCYNMGNTEYGLLCRECGPGMLDQCNSCSYTECKIHSMFNTGEGSPTRCQDCFSLICQNCTGNAGCHRTLYEESSDDIIDMCINCYIKYRDY